MLSENTSLSRAVVDCLYLCSHSEAHRGYTVSQFQRYFMYPVLENKIQIFHQEDKPIGLVTWCYLPQDIGDEFLNGRYDLEIEDYLAEDGEELWGIEFVAPFGHARKIMSEMRRYYKQRYGPSRPVYWRRLHAPDIKHKGVF